MKKHMVFAGVLVAGLVMSIAVANAQRPGGMGLRGGRQGQVVGQGPGQGFGPGAGRFGGGPGGQFGRGPGGPGMGRGRGAGLMMLAGLDLTEQQKTQVKSLFESQRDAGHGDMQALIEARQALHGALFANVVDAGAIAGLQAKVAAAEQAQLEKHVKNQLALSAILTSEQRATLLARQIKRR